MMVEAGQRNDTICRAWQVIHCLHSRLLQLLVFLLISVPLSGCNESVKRQLVPTPSIPRYLPGAVNITVREGSMAVLPCTIKNLGTKKVVWRRLNSEEFLTIGKTTWVKNDNIMVEHEVELGEVTKWDLMIKNVKPNDSGIYECQITSTQEYAYHVQLNVVGPAITKPAISVFGNDYVDHGEQIKLICNATGGPQIPEEIDWFKDGDKIDSQKYKEIVITKYRSLKSQSLTSELLIDRSNGDDSGTYICRSSQDVIGSIKVTVLIADTTNVKRGTGSQIHPPNQGGASITRYAKTPLMLSLIISLLLSWCVL